MSTETFSITNMGARAAAPQDRSEAEATVQAAAIPSGTARRKKGRSNQILWRATDAKKEQLQRLAERLSIGQIEKVSYTTVMERALDALEEKLRGAAQHDYGKKPVA